MNEKEIFNFLTQELNNFKYNNNNLIKSKTGDGRAESTESEHEFCKALKKFLEQNTDFTAEIAPPRCWYDIAIYYKNFFLPVNIKLTDGKGADNISSKLGLFYALTGIDPKNVKNLTHWDVYANALTNNYNDNLEADYYLIVYNKITENILLNSLKRINKLVPNGNNLPFQCNWGILENQVPTSRNLQEQCKYLMNIFIQSWKKRINFDAFSSLLEWEEYYNE